MLYTLSCPWRLGKQANYMRTLWGGLSYSVPWQTLGILCPSLWGLHNNHLTWGNLLPNLQMSEKKYQLRVTIKLFAHCERKKKKEWILECDLFNWCRNLCIFLYMMNTPWVACACLGSIIWNYSKKSEGYRLIWRQVRKNRKFQDKWIIKDQGQYLHRFLT